MCICWVDWGGKGFRWREGLKICVGVECRWGGRCVQCSMFFGGRVELKDNFGRMEYVRLGRGGG